MKIFQRGKRSLFGEILDWMLTPLLLLWPISLALTWLVAQNIAGKPFDRALEYNVQALAKLVVVRNQQMFFSLPAPAREICVPTTATWFTTRCWAYVVNF